MLHVIVYGLVAVCVVTFVEVAIARFSGRRPQIGAAMLCGLIGIAYFIGTLYAAGLVP